MTNKKLLFAYGEARRIQALIEHADILVIQTEGNLTNFPESNLGWKSLPKQSRRTIRQAITRLAKLL